MFLGTENVTKKCRNTIVSNPIDKVDVAELSRLKVEIKLCNEV